MGTFWWLIARAVGIDAPLWVFLLLQPVVTALTFLPVSIGGIGVQESAAVLLLVTMDFDYALVFAFALIVRGLSMLIDVSIGFRNLGRVLNRENLDRILRGPATLSER